jgi:tetratricopeptide (TPR) repeat protein
MQIRKNYYKLFSASVIGKRLWSDAMPILDKSKLIQTIYELVENDRAFEENDRTNQAMVESMVQAFLSGLFSMRYDSESESIMWHMENCLEKKSLDQEDLVHVGEKLLNLGTVDDAINVLTKAVEIKPNSFEARDKLATAFMHQGDFKSAIEQLKILLDLDPNNEMVHFDYGLAFSDAGLIDEAIAEFERAGGLDSAPVHVCLGFAYYGKGDEENAIKEFELAIECDSGFGFDMYDGLGEIYRKRKMMDKAIEFYSQGENPNLNIGLTFLDSNLPEKAIEKLNQVIKKDPNNSIAHYNIGIAYQQVDQFDKAELEFLEAMRIDPAFEASIIRLKELKAAQSKKNSGKKTKNKERFQSSETENHVIFKSFENRLRGLVGSTLEQNCGEKWWKQRVPEKIQKECLQRKNEREANKQVKTNAVHPIYYSYIHDLLEIISRNDNWVFFEPAFGNKLNLETKIQELNTLRSDMMHGRRLSHHNVQKLKLYIADLNHCILPFNRQQSKMRLFLEKRPENL